MTRKKSKINILAKFINLMWFVPSDVLQRSTEAFIWSKQKLKAPILEVGTGDGKISEMLFEQTRIDYGIDIDAKSIKRAKKSKLYKNVIAADVNKLPFKVNSFNAVVANSTLEHFANDKKALKEISRVTKINGHLFFTVPTKRFSDFILNNFSQHSLSDLNKRLDHRNYHSLSQWGKKLMINNFKIVEHKYYLNKDQTRLWYKFFRLSTFKIRGKEVWSYLHSSRFSNFVPEKIIKLILTRILISRYKYALNDQGLFIFIKAQKIK
jgi:ubiquinone/menaquinone biosynthesis C-methylase UbiE